MSVTGSAAEGRGLRLGAVAPGGCTWPVHQGTRMCTRVHSIQTRRLGACHSQTAPHTGRHSPQGSEHHRRSHHPEHICGPAPSEVDARDPEPAPGQRRQPQAHPSPDGAGVPGRKRGSHGILHLDAEVLTWVEETGSPAPRPSPPLRSHHRLTFCKRLDQCRAHAGRPLEALACHSERWFSGAALTTSGPCGCMSGGKARPRASETLSLTKSPLLSCNTRTTVPLSSPYAWRRKGRPAQSEDPWPSQTTPPGHPHRLSGTTPYSASGSWHFCGHLASREEPAHLSVPSRRRLLFSGSRVSDSPVLHSSDWSLTLGAGPLVPARCSSTIQHQFLGNVCAEPVWVATGPTSNPGTAHCPHSCHWHRCSTHQLLSFWTQPWRKR